MTEIQLAGKVDCWGVCPKIGGVDVVNAMDAFRHDAQVRVYLGIEPPAPLFAEGQLCAWHGFAGTDVTPAELPEIRVGDRDLFNELDEYDGRTVLLIVESLDLERIESEEER